MILLRDLRGCPTKRIGEVTGFPIGTVMSGWRRAPASTGEGIC